MDHPPEYFPGSAARRVPLVAATTPFEVSPLVPASPTGWIEPAMGEWILVDGAFGDRHPYDELNYVLEGQLAVTAAGTTVVAGPGDVVRVRAGTAAVYAAQGQARMLFVYGSNPRGLPSEVFPAAVDHVPVDHVPVGHVHVDAEARLPGVPLSRCGACGYVAIPPATTCQVCKAPAVVGRSGPRGTLATWTLVHQAPARFTTPYVLGWADLDEPGPGILGHVTGKGLVGDISGLRAGIQVLIWEVAGDPGSVRFEFEPL